MLNILMTKLEQRKVLKLKILNKMIMRILTVNLGELTAIQKKSNREKYKI